MFRILDAYDRLPEPRRFGTFVACLAGAASLGLAADGLGAGGAGQALAMAALGGATLVRIAHVHARRG